MTEYGDGVSLSLLYGLDANFMPEDIILPCEHKWFAQQFVTFYFNLILSCFQLSY